MSSRFTQKWRPRNLKLVQPQSSFCNTFNLNFEKHFLPIQIILVFPLFIRNPEKLPKISSVFNAASKECSVPSKKSVVSSANCVNLNSFVLIFIPIISGLILISRARISAAVKNKYEIGSPCLQPLSIFIFSDNIPHCTTNAVMSELNNFVHFKKFLLKPKCCSIIYRNFHEIELNAFSKSMSIIAPGILYCSVICIRS